MEKISYGQFSQEFHRRTASARIPLSGVIEVTRRCPLSCIHCYNNLPFDDRPALAGELAFDEHCRILDEITDAGCLWLLYTGGEIFARKDFLDIYRYAKSKGLLITLFTNATMVTPGIADILMEWRPFLVEVSVYGRTREVHESVTGMPGSFDRCMSGIRLLMERKLPLRLKSVALTVNLHEMHDLRRFSEEELGVEFRYDPMVNPRIDASPRPLRARLKPHEVVDLELADEARAEAWRQFCRRYNGPVHPPEEADELHHCGGGLQSFAIDPEGRLSMCVLARSETYDLRSGNFREGWEHFLFGVRHRKITRQTKCVACEIKAMCGMCAANGELEEGDPEAPVDYYCQVAHLKAYGLGFRIPPHGECRYCEDGSASRDLQNPLPIGSGTIYYPDEGDGYEQR
jgi:radical SAM protein with 4Fe4S-binding SPASM domain